MRILTALLAYSFICTTLFAQPTPEDINQAAKEHDQANIAMMKKDELQAYVHLQKAAELDPDNSTYLNSAAFMAMKLGNPEIAIKYLDQAIILDQERFGADHPNVAMILNNKASVYSKMGNNAKAIEYYQQAYDIVVKAVGEKHPQSETIKGFLNAEKEK
ncbi:MAG: tetratricopeptide repeat protein [Emcibacteraceae bacterium]|nr:tetratricopeptide repeat protein [Emcibacteraceae bacterium]